MDAYEAKGRIQAMDSGLLRIAVMFYLAAMVSIIAAVDLFCFKVFANGAPPMLASSSYSWSSIFLSCVNNEQRLSRGYCEFIELTAHA